MKHISFIITIIVLCITSCSSEMTDETVNNDGIRTYRMYLDGSLGSYNGEMTSRAAMTVADGTKLYLLFGSKTGTAVYHKSQNEWSLTYTGSLSSSGSCSAYYLPDATESNGNIALTSSSAIYSTTSGTYTYSSDGSITVKATLNPQLSRIRLKGTSGTQVTLEGVKTATSFSTVNGTLQTSSPALSVTVASSGYSQYIYYVEPSTNSLSIINGSKQFTLKNPLKSGGKTGYFTIPTEASHNGWTMTDNIADVESVDLGLSVKWASFNVGARSPEDYGDYYAWGETETKSNYSWSTYKWCKSSSTTMTKYCKSSTYGTVDDKTTLDPDDDVAHVKWGGSWRMPTYAEMEELRTKCTWTYTTLNGVYGCKVTATNGNSIFLPAVGYYIGRNVSDVASWGAYWTSSLHANENDGGYILYFNPERTYIYHGYRYYGPCVRPVCPYINFKTCSEASAIALALSENNVATSETYSVTGYITSIVGSVSNGQQTFWMADTKDGGKVLEAYWANLPSGISDFTVGSKVTITGNLIRYNTTPEIKNATVSIIEKADGGESSGVISITGTTLTLTNNAATAGNESVTITIDDLGIANGTAAIGTYKFSDGTKLTVEKGDGNTTPTYYSSSNGFRIYANNVLKFEAIKTIAKIVIDCDSYYGTEYVGNKTATFTVSGKTATYCNYNESNSGGTQLRAQTITIYYASGSSAKCKNYTSRR